MNPVDTALSIITLLEKEEPFIQAGIMDIVNLWRTNPAAVQDILKGEVTGFNDIVAAARIQQGLPPVTPIVDPDPVA